MKPSPLLMYWSRTLKKKKKKKRKGKEKKGMRDCCEGEGRGKGEVVGREKRRDEPH